MIGDVEEHDILLVPESQVELWLEANTTGKGIGISQQHQGIHELHDAYREAMQARLEAFVRNEGNKRYVNQDKHYEEIPTNFVSVFTQLFGTAKVEEALSKYASLCFKARMGKLAPGQLLSTTETMMDHLIEMYGRIVDIEREDFDRLRAPLHFVTMEDYVADLEQWLLKIQNIILGEFDDYKNKEKINRALQFIHENYHKDLNMAVVSNSVSMNYSLFSLSFKQYTGLNFVNYIKKIRMEEAKRMLEETDTKVVQISQMVGYDNEKHFMKTFKSIYGISPGEYRKNRWLGKSEKH